MWALHNAPCNKKAAWLRNATCRWEYCIIETTSACIYGLFSLIWHNI